MQGQPIEPVVKVFAEAPLADGLGRTVQPRLQRGGRIIYVGAGTSGRLGLLDSVELNPTFSWPSERSPALLAGGASALYKAVEGAEDNRTQGAADLQALQPTADDVVLHDTLPGDGLAERRLPFASALTLLACDEFDARNRSYVEIAQAIRRHVQVERVRADNRELFARMAFNIFVSNDDDHLRNHGFVRDPRLGGWRLSPLYDVVPRERIVLAFKHPELRKYTDFAAA